MRRGMRQARQGRRKSSPQCRCGLVATQRSGRTLESLGPYRNRPGSSRGRSLLTVREGKKHGRASRGTTGTGQLGLPMVDYPAKIFRTLFCGIKVPSPERAAMSPIIAIARGRDDNSRSSLRHATCRILLSITATLLLFDGLQPDVDASSVSRGFGAWKASSGGNALPVFSVTGNFLLLSLWRPADMGHTW